MLEYGTQQYYNDDSTITLNVNIGQLGPGSLLKNKVVLITGAAKGIGLAIAEACVAQGAKVILTGRSQEKLDAACRSLGVCAAAMTLNVCDVAVFDQFLEEATQLFGNIDCLINNAGISLHEGDFMKVTEESWDAQIETNLKAPYFLTQAWLRYYRARGMKSGRIIMMASDTSGMGSSIPYGISKVGISSLTRGLAKHVVREGVRINAVAPGTTKTAMTDCWTGGKIVRTTTEGWRTLFPEEIAQTCVFLLSDLSACICGQVIGCTEANICFDNMAINFSVEQETNP